VLFENATDGAPIEKIATADSQVGWSSGMYQRSSR
jgi:hypothetical protein